MEVKKKQIEEKDLVLQEMQARLQEREAAAEDFKKKLVQFEVSRWEIRRLVQRGRLLEETNCSAGRVRRIEAGSEIA